MEDGLLGDAPAGLLRGAGAGRRRCGGAGGGRAGGAATTPGPLPSSALTTTPPAPPAAADEARREWYDDDSLTAQDALKLLVHRIQATGSPVKQHHLQALYERCASGEELDKALRLTRLNSLARGDLRQHQPFSHRTSAVLVRRAVSVGAPDVAQRALRTPSDYGLAAASLKEFHPVLIYYSKEVRWGGRRRWEGREGPGI